MVGRCLWQQPNDFLGRFLVAIFFVNSRIGAFQEEGIETETNVLGRNCSPRGVAVAKGCPVSCLAHLLREGVGTSLDFRTTRSSLCPCSPRLPFPLPPPSLSSSGFVIVPPTFSSIKEIRDYNLHLRFQTVLDSHPFDWWSFLLSSSSNVLFPVNFLSSGSILHSLCRPYLYHVLRPSD